MRRHLRSPKNPQNPLAIGIARINEKYKKLEEETRQKFSGDSLIPELVTLDNLRLEEIEKLRQTLSIEEVEVSGDKIRADILRSQRPEKVKKRSYTLENDISNTQTTASASVISQPQNEKSFLNAYAELNSSNTSNPGVPMRNVDSKQNSLQKDSPEVKSSSSENSSAFAANSNSNVVVPTQIGAGATEQKSSAAIKKPNIENPADAFSKIQSWDSYLTHLENVLNKIFETQKNEVSNFIRNEVKGNIIYWAEISPKVKRIYEQELIPCNSLILDCHILASNEDVNVKQDYEKLIKLLTELKKNIFEKDRLFAHRETFEPYAALMKNFELFKENIAKIGANSQLRESLDKLFHGAAKDVSQESNVEHPIATARRQEQNSQASRVEQKQSGSQSQSVSETHSQSTPASNSKPAVKASTQSNVAVANSASLANKQGTKVNNAQFSSVADPAAVSKKQRSSESGKDSVSQKDKNSPARDGSSSGQTTTNSSQAASSGVRLEELNFSDIKDNKALFTYITNCLKYLQKNVDELENATHDDLPPLVRTNFIEKISPLLATIYLVIQDLSSSSEENTKKLTKDLGALKNLLEQKIVNPVSNGLLLVKDLQKKSLQNNVDEILKQTALLGQKQLVVDKILNQIKTIPTEIIQTSSDQNNCLFYAIVGDYLAHNRLDELFVLIKDELSKQPVNYGEFLKQYGLGQNSFVSQEERSKNQNLTAVDAFRKEKIDVIVKRFAVALRQKAANDYYLNAEKIKKLKESSAFQLVNSFYRFSKLPSDAGAGANIYSLQFIQDKFGEINKLTPDELKTKAGKHIEKINKNIDKDYHDFMGTYAKGIDPKAPGGEQKLRELQTIYLKSRILVDDWLTNEVFFKQYYDHMTKLGEMSGQEMLMAVQDILQKNIRIFKTTGRIDTSEDFNQYKDYINVHFNHAHYSTFLTKEVLTTFNKERAAQGLDTLCSNTTFLSSSSNSTQTFRLNDMNVVFASQDFEKQMLDLLNKDEAKTIYETFNYVKDSNIYKFKIDDSSPKKDPKDGKEIEKENILEIEAAFGAGNALSLKSQAGKNVSIKKQFLGEAKVAYTAFTAGKTDAEKENVAICLSQIQPPSKIDICVEAFLEMGFRTVHYTDADGVKKTREKPKAIKDTTKKTSVDALVPQPPKPLLDQAKEMVTDVVKAIPQAAGMVTDAVKVLPQMAQMAKAEVVKVANSHPNMTKVAAASALTVPVFWAAGQNPFAAYIALGAVVECLWGGLGTSGSIVNFVTSGMGKAIIGGAALKAGNELSKRCFGTNLAGLGTKIAEKLTGMDMANLTPPKP